MKITTYAGFNFGTGVGDNDLKIIGLAQGESIGDIDLSTLIGSGELVSNITDDTDYTHQLNFVAIPGYFYVGDVECYMFSNKGSQISHPIVSSGTLLDTYDSGVTYIKLKDVPDGISTFVSTIGKSNSTIQSKETGAAPIIVHRFTSGSLSSYHSVFDRAIYSSSGTGGVLGYTYVLSGEVITTTISPGEIEAWPAPTSPLSKIAVTSSYWNSGSALLPNTFQYDPEYNCIVFEDGVVSTSDEIIIEFESANEPFIIKDIDMSPITTFPDNYVLCMTTDDVISGEIPSYIKINSTKDMVSSKDTADITVEVFSKYGNRLEDQDVLIQVIRNDLSITTVGGSDPDPIGYLKYYPYVVCHSGELINDHFDLISISGDLYQNDKLIFSGNGILNIPSCGYITSGEIPEIPWILSCDFTSSVIVRTGAQGISHVSYISPAIITTPIDISVYASINGITKSVDLKLVPDKSDIYYFSDLDSLDTELIVSGDIYNSKTYISGYTDTILTPSSAGICSMSEYVDSLRDNREPVYIYPARVFSMTLNEDWRPGHITETINMTTESEKKIVLEYSGELAGNIVMKTKAKRHIAKGDMRCWYA